jgi:hypothetical protein
MHVLRVQPWQSTPLLPLQTMLHLPERPQQALPLLPLQILP